MEITDGDLREFRERAKTELRSGCDCGRMRWDDVVEALCEEVARLRNESSGSVGNVAAIRGVLESILNLAYEVKDANDDGWSRTSIPTEFVIDTINNALAKPSRNCDVGTAEEQYARFREACKEHYGNCSAGCPYRDPFHSCELKWAQMPYEAKESEAK